MTTFCTILLALNSFFGWQGLVVLLIVVLLFGGKKIPELMKGLGKGVHSFKQGMEEAKREMNRPLEDDENKKD